MELPGGEVTLLFTDIEGSTRLLQALGDRYDALLEEHRRILRTAFAAHHGLEVHVEGDGFFVVFAGAGDALAACVEAQLALARHPWPGGVVPRVRMGLHTGEAWPAGGDYTSLAVHRAARIGAAAHGGQVVVSEAAARALSTLSPDTTLVDLGEYRLKDFDDPQRLHQVAHPGLCERFPALRTPPAAGHNLPRQHTSFVGRDQDMAQVGKLLEAGALVTVIGPGGTGKTRLALELAAAVSSNHAGGACLVELASVAGADAVLATVAAALGVREQAGRSLLDTLAGDLAAREVLLVLDNCEHVLGAVASLLGRLLATCDAVTILATSREPLLVAGEQVWRLAPLDLPGSDDLGAEALLDHEAVRLFVQRAELASSSFALSAANSPEVARLCRRLDGLPLAIELAAARVGTMPLARIAAQLDARRDPGPGRGDDRRHRTLHDLIAWSHGLLDQPEQVLFRRLAVFAGGWTAEAAEEVCGGGALAEGGVLDALSQLVAKSLVTAADDDDDFRYSMLETVRSFASQQLDDVVERTMVEDAHLAWCARLASAQAALLRGPEQRMAIERLGREHDNLRAGLQRAVAGGDVLAGMRVGGGIWPFWLARGHLSEGRTWLESLLDRGDERPTRERAATLDGAGQIARLLGDLPGALRHFERALAVVRDLGERGGEARGLVNLASLHMAHGDLAGARELFEVSQAIHRELGDRRNLGAGASGLGAIAALQGDFAGAQRYFEEALEVNREAGDDHNMALAMCNLGNVLLEQGDMDGAGRQYEEARLVLGDLGDRSGVTRALLGLGQVATDQGRHGDARRHFEETLELRRAQGDRPGTARVLVNLVDPYLGAGQVAAARAAVEEAMAIGTQMDDVGIIGAALHNSAQVAEAEGDRVRAADLYRQAIAHRHRLGDRPWVLRGLEALAGVDDDAARGSTLLAAAGAVRQALGPAARPPEAAVSAAAAERLRQSLGPDAFTAAAAAGQSLDLDEAVALAVTVLGT